METSLDAALVARLTASASAVGSPGPAPWQPVHTVYGGANLFSAETAKKMGDVALRSLEGYAPNATSFAEAIGIPGAIAAFAPMRATSAIAIGALSSIGRSERPCTYSMTM